MKREGKYERKRMETLHGIKMKEERMEGEEQKERDENKSG